MRRSMLLLLAVAGLVAGCASFPIGGGDNLESPVGRGPGSAEPLPSGDAPVRETPNPDVVDSHPAGIDHFAIAPDGRTVVVFYWGGNRTCFGLHSVDVAVADDGTPTITVNEGTRPEAVGQPCTMEALLKSTTVTLGQPIVVDTSQPAGASSEPELATEPEMAEVRTDVLDPISVAVTGYHLTADGLTLTAHFYGGVTECYGLSEASLDTASRPFSVTIREGRRPDAEVCIEIAVAKGFAFTLDSALIIDGSLEAR